VPHLTILPQIPFDALVQTSASDRQRDAILAAANYPVLRFQSRAKPSENWNFVIEVTSGLFHFYYAIARAVAGSLFADVRPEKAPTADVSARAAPENGLRVSALEDPAIDIRSLHRSLHLSDDYSTCGRVSVRRPRLSDKFITTDS
jgi:hypothetical protein